MGPKGKKKQKNAFSFFLEEYVENLRTSGRRVSYKIAAEECSPLWMKLSEEEKEKYNQLAATYKASQKVDKNQKFTSTGVSWADYEKQQKELKKKIEKADAEIKTIISLLDSETIKTHLFYIIHCNYYCKTEEGIYVPGEIALAEFNLKDGIRRSYHTLINPGSIPLGYAFEAKETIDKVHGLPFPPNEEGNSNYSGILEEICQFVKPGTQPDGTYPPFYSIENNIKASENILHALIESVTPEGENFFRVYHIHKMFFWLKNKCVERLRETNIGFPVMSTAENEINKDEFCYVPGISCWFHAILEDKYYSCSLSIVQRFVYVICDHCCQYVKVSLIPGKHCRLKSETDKDVISARLAKSSKVEASSQSSEAEPKERSINVDDSDSSKWMKETAASYLHEEIEASFGHLAISSVIARSTMAFSSPRSTAATIGSVRGEEEEFDDDDDDDLDEDSKNLMPLGRGSVRSE